MGKGIFLIHSDIRYNNGMEQDYNPETWKKDCPRARCRKPEFGLDFVSVPASLTESLAPKNGLYSNAIVRYEETGAVYIYSGNGTPVLVKEGNASS